MSTYETSYSNITTDLLNVVPDLDRYQKKDPVTGWEVHSGNVYRAGGVGYVGMLYQNGRELGAAQSALVDVDATDEWYYDSTADQVYFYSTTDPDELKMEKGEDWETLKTRVNNEAAEEIRSYLGRPILPRKGVGTESASSRVWDNIVIKCNAMLTCAYLIGGDNSELSDMLFSKVYSEDVIAETGTRGLLYELKTGVRHLWNEKTSGVKFREISVDSNTTGSIIGIVGSPSVFWDRLKVVVTSAGTLTAGSASSVEYSVYGRDDTGTKTSLVVDGETMTGGWDSISSGLYAMFSPGVYTLNDEWEVEVSAMKKTNARIRSLQMEGH
ncbi:MAG: hypothetical protein ACE5D7_00830 [Fidelibacterota bacterium]